jgi:hypothetical protein
MISRIVSLVGAASALALLPTCAARFDGALDDEPIPSFSTAAFALVDNVGTAVSVRGLALPRDSCVEATTLTQLRLDQLQPSSPSRADDTADALVTWFQRVLPEGSWFVELNIEAPGKAVVRDLSVNLESSDNDADVSLTLCRSEGDPRSNDGVFLDDLDCSRAAEGRLDVAYDEEAGTLRIQALKEPVTFVGNNGRTDGMIRFDLQFDECPSMAETIENAPCRSSCTIDGAGQQFCQTICDP